MPTVSIPAGGSPIQVAWATEVAQAINSMFPVGHVITGFFTSDPADYLLLDGRNLSRSGLYTALYAAVGPYGGPGNGTTTWDLPNMANRSQVGVGSLVGLGGLAGQANPSLTQHAHSMQNHTHSGTSGGESQGHAHALEAHQHYVNMPSAGGHSHDSTNGVTNVVQSPGGPYNVNGSGSNWVTFDVGHIYRTSTDGAHDHDVWSDGAGQLGGWQGNNVGHTHAFTSGGPSTANTDQQGVATVTNHNYHPVMGMAFAVKYR